jgi:hypothetical protein
VEIFFDSIQEGIWFQRLHPALRDTILSSFPDRPIMPKLLGEVLAYDRPDVVLTDKGKPVLVVERTTEVPSGHNVGQRFARLVAAAQMQIPVIYFGPYAAYKHGGETQGPRYMNLRLFYALQNLARIEDTAVTTINWPVDENYEIIQGSEKDQRICKYLELFFELYPRLKISDITRKIMDSSFEQEQEQERQEFISTEIVNPEQYNDPPDSVIIAPAGSMPIFGEFEPNNLKRSEVVLYKVGMQNIRSDPYTGMAMLYLYLYCGGMRNRTRNMVLHFPNVNQEMWFEAASSSRERKDIRLFRLAADGILFSDGYLPQSSL